MIFSTFLAIVSLAVVLHAKECGDGPFRSIESQEEFDSWIQEGDCTSIRGALSFAPTYSGAFILNNITSIWDIWVSSSSNESYVETPNITSIELPDLLKAYYLSIDLYHLPLPKVSVSAPKLKSLTRLFISTGDVELYFPSLEDTENIDLEATILSHDFKQLFNVNQTLMICTSQNCESDPARPLDLDFPSLDTVNVISLNGSFSSISMPLLARFGYNGGNYNFPGLTINHAGEPLAVDFPKLDSANKLINMTGNFERFQDYGSLISKLANTVSISLPSFGNARDIEIRSELPLDVNFTALENATSIVLRGNIASAVFPKLERADSIVINTTLPIDCSSFNSATAKAKADPIDDGHVKGPYTCPGSESKGLSTGAKAGIGVGVGVAGVAILAAILWWWRRRNQKKGDPIQTASESNVSLQQRGG